MGTYENASWQGLAEWLTQVSKEVCEANDCTEDEHHCESYAYVSEDGVCHDVCACDYWRGWGSADEDAHGHLAAIPLPFGGDGRDLREAFEQWADWD